MEFPQESRGRACRWAASGGEGGRYSKKQPSGPFSSPSPRQALLHGWLWVAEGSGNLLHAVGSNEMLWGVGEMLWDVGEMMWDVGEML